MSTRPTTSTLKRKADDESPVDIQLTRPPPPLPQQFYAPPPGPIGMDFHPAMGQQWALANGPRPWGVQPNMIHNPYYQRGIIRNNARMYVPQGRGNRSQNFNSFNNFNSNQNLWSRPPPPILDGSSAMGQGLVDSFQNQMASASWMPNTNVPPPLPPQTQQPPPPPPTSSEHQPSTASQVSSATSLISTSNPFLNKNYQQTLSTLNHNGESSYHMNQYNKKKKKEKCVKPPQINGRKWNREDAEKALALENECQKNSSDQSIVIKFPDPELSKDIVKKMHPLIESVHFQAPSGPRFCFAQVAEGANVDKVITELEKIKFGTGKLVVERKLPKNEDPVVPEAIDPYTLYIGNLPTNITAQEVKDKFPTHSRVDIGYAAKMKFTRYAFVRFNTVEESMEAYKSALNMQIASRSIILRFRRHKGPVGPPGENQAEHLKTIPQIPKVIKIKKEKEDEEEEEHDDDEDDEDDDDDDEDDDDDDDDDDDEEGETNHVEEEYDDDDDDEDEDDDEQEEEEELENETARKVEKEYDDDDDDDGDDKFQDLFEKFKRKNIDLDDWNKLQ